MGTHNICFLLEIRKYLPDIFLLSRPTFKMTLNHFQCSNEFTLVLLAKKKSCSIKNRNYSSTRVQAG